MPIEGFEHPFFVFSGDILEALTLVFSEWHNINRFIQD